MHCNLGPFGKIFVYVDMLDKISHKYISFVNFVYMRKFFDKAG